MLFRNNYAFLSNFQTCNINYKGKMWPSSEHMYVAAKSLDPKVHEAVRIHSIKGLKSFGRKIILRPDWNEVKVSYMRSILQLKFKNKYLYNLLQGVQCEIVETNYWHDNFWGNCECSKCNNKQSENMLGKLLMEIRDA